MPPKKHQKVTKKTESPTVPNLKKEMDHQSSGHVINAEYYAFVAQDLQTIKDKYPTLAAQKPLPESGDAGFLGLKGFGAPYSAEKFDSCIAESEMQYHCFCNFLHQDFFKSVIDFVPLYRERVIEYADATLKDPSVLLKNPTIVQSDFLNGADMPAGSLLHLNPCEESHAVLHKVASLIRDGAPESVLLSWIRALLSAPFIFQKYDDPDKLYCEVNSLREDASSKGDSVSLTARQMVHNVYGFKKRKETQNPGTIFSAEKIAKMWASGVRVSRSSEQMK